MMPHTQCTDAARQKSKKHNKSRIINVELINPIESISTNIVNKQTNVD
jgi:hypothetical protein